MTSKTNRDCCDDKVSVSSDANQYVITVNSSESVKFKIGLYFCIVKTQLLVSVNMHDVNCQLRYVNPEDKKYVTFKNWKIEIITLVIYSIWSRPSVKHREKDQDLKQTISFCSIINFKVTDVWDSSTRWNVSDWIIVHYQYIWKSKSKNFARCVFFFLLSSLRIFCVNSASCEYQKGYQ